MKKSHRRHLSWIAPLGALVLASTGCSVKRQLDEMHDSTVGMGRTTQQMSDTTQRMSHTTDGMAGTTQDLRDISAALYEDARQGSSKDLRMKIIDAMEKASSIEKKLAESAAYQYAFEFQLFKKSLNTQEELEELYASAILEYARNAREYIEGNVHDMDKASVSPAKKSERWQNLYAFVATMHKVNPNQEVHAAERRTNPKSMFDLITSGLELTHQMARGRVAQTELSPHVVEIERAHQDLVYLLQVRQNFLAALPLGFISKANENLLVAARNAFFKWKVDVSGLTAKQLEYYNLMLGKSLETREALVRAGVTPKTDKMLARLIKNARFPTQADRRSAGATGDALIQSLSDKYQAFLKQPQVEDGSDNDGGQN